MASGYPVGQFPCPAKHVVDHRLGQPAGERVLLTRVVAAEDHEPFGRHFETVGELRSRHRERRAARREDARQTLRTRTRRAPPRRGHARATPARVARYGRHRSRSSGVGLLSGGAHRTAAATYASRSSSPSSDDTDVAWFANPSSMQRAEEPVARTIAGEDPAGAVPTVRSRREPDDQHASLRITETGNRASPIRLVTKRRALLGGDPLAPLDEPGTRPARDDLVGRAARNWSVLGTGHSGIVRVGFGAVRLQLIVNPIASSVTIARTRADDPHARGRARRRSHRDRATRRRDQAGA